MLRHDKQQTAARYIHAVNGKQIEAGKVSGCD
jgi:hypothetical protein